jgi:hypothetical protein
MTVMEPRRIWTDPRIDDLSKKVGGGFEKVDQRFEKVDQRFEKVDQRFEKVDATFREVRSEMKAGFDRLDDKFDRKFDRLMWVLVTLGGSIIVALLGIIGSLNHIHIG